MKFLTSSLQRLANLTSLQRAVIGSGVALAFVVVQVSGLQDESWTSALGLFAALVLLPLAFDLLLERNDSGTAARWFDRVRQAQLPAGALLAVGCARPAGVGAALLTLPWLVVMAGLASVGLRRWWRHGWARPPGRLCGDIAMVYAALGALWWLVERVGGQPWRLPSATVAVIAVHFYYAGFFLCFLAGMALRWRPESRGAARIAVGVVLGGPALVVGMILARFGFGPAPAAAAGLALTMAGLGVAVWQVRIALEHGATPLARALIGSAGVALFFAMVLAGLAAFRPFQALVPWLDAGHMRMLHGTLIALVTGLGGVLGWRMAERRAG